MNKMSIFDKLKSSAKKLQTEASIIKTKISTKRDLIKKLDYDQLRKLYEKTTGTKAVINVKDFNTGKVLNTRKMSRGELENRIFLNQRITIDKIAGELRKEIKNMNINKSKQKMKKSEERNITFNLKV